MLSIDKVPKIFLKSGVNTEVLDCLDVTTALPNYYAGYEVYTNEKCYKIKIDSDGNREFNIDDYFWTTITINSNKWRDFSSLA